MEPVRPKVGVGVIVTKNNKVLYGKRKRSHETGFWSFPGGHLEFNEEFEECAAREVLEEAGIKIKNVRFAALTNDFFKNEGKHYITIFMLAEHDSGEPADSEEMEDWRWMEWGKSPEPMCLPNANLLKQGYNPFKKI
ncbi:MAG: NUDIX domain-containing protein [archaeon]